MFKLTKPRRCDEAHFEIFTSLPQDLQEAIRLTKARHKPNRDTDWSLVITNRRRRAISLRRQKKEAEGKLTVAVPTEGNDPGYPLFAGTRLIGCLTTKYTTNGVFYLVLSIGEVCVLQDEHTKATFEATPAEIAKWSNLRWAMTYSRAQGSTLRGSVGLWDLNSSHFTLANLYVGISRVRDGNLLHANI